MSRRLTRDRLAAMTLRRQFPTIRGRGRRSILELFRRLGPVQTQVPRSAFLFTASRLPGATYADIVGLFESFELVKSTNIRGTVHAGDREQHARLAAVSERSHHAMMRNKLMLHRRSPHEVAVEIERFVSDDWRQRDEIVTHVRGWLRDNESIESSEFAGIQPENLLWGWPQLLRRPGDQRWQTRTDVYRRAARSLYDLPAIDADTARRDLVRRHLASYGPATRRDVAWWMGERLTAIDAAVDTLGEEVVRLDGTNGITYLDLADPPRGGSSGPGVRLLPEFDGLLLGYEGPGRTRFLDEPQLDQIWSRTNGIFTSVVLQDDRLVGTWKTVTRGARTDLEITTFRGCHAPSESDVGPAVDATSLALGTPVTDVRIVAPEG